MNTAIPAYVRPGTTFNLSIWGMPFTYVLKSDDAAVMYDFETGEVVDVAQNLESAESMALQGYVPVPVGARGFMENTIQFDALVAAYNDCFGRHMTDRDGNYIG